MAFNTEGWRKIVIGERVYFWQTDGWEPALFRVRPEREPHRLLLATCSQCGSSSGFLRDATPGVVRGGVEFALNNEWLGTRPQLRLVAFSEPLRYVSLQPSWLTSTVVGLAEGIYADQAFDWMPILADALQDAGCDDPDILNHCRDANQMHVRGCWVVDLLLGKT
jgi:hypothetical protein